ncbi:aminotransferase class III-fold pyridoxal phosphate-dependent enzyme [Herbiconiux sp. YIM B11900]|uniref:aminotransferase class III-fold pyridoxal phosphate-dependent enzyme n=1 Tax=Herbiconiux sp. YIM B11900 TaxID=3404131 RepID=UPI003F86A669
MINDARQPSALLKQRVDADYPVVTHGLGVYLYDTGGREYLDACSGAMTASIGHGVKEVATAAAAQAEQVAFSYRTQFTNVPAENLARRLTELAPGDLNSTFFVNSGSEASEFAIRAAVNHWREKGQPAKAKILSRQVSYHGMTMGALSMSGHAARRPDYGPLLHSFPATAPAYSYRHARDGESEDDYAVRAAEEFETAVIAQDPSTVAAIIVEPIVGAAGGVLVPPRGYLRHLREVCDRLEILLILDEVITAIGRTGEWFACSSEDVVPDIVIFGKGISGGYSPMAGVLLRQHMVDTIRDGTGVAPFGHTFSNNPLGAATCLAVLDVIERDGLLANARERGAQLEQGLRQLAARFPFMVDVRGRGLLWGFEFVVDAARKTPPPAYLNTADVFVRECFSRGLMVYPGGIAPLNNASIVCPPLSITSCEVERLLRTLGDALNAMASHMDAWSERTGNAFTLEEP